MVGERLRPLPAPGLSPALEQLLDRCWAADPVDRPSFAAISLELCGMQPGGVGYIPRQFSCPPPPPPHFLPHSPTQVRHMSVIFLKQAVQPDKGGDWKEAVTIQ